MKIRVFAIAAFVGLEMILKTTSLCAQQEHPSRFSHKGIKGAISSGSFDMISERQLKEGDGGALSLGYGFTDRFTFWLTLLGSEHSPVVDDERATKFGGLELNLQHKFKTLSRLQPYGKVGFGVYGLEEQNSNVTLLGAGLNLAVGVDFFFSRHFGVGAELMFKKLDYVSQRIETAAGEVISDLQPHLNGDTAGFVLTFTVQ